MHEFPRSALGRSPNIGLVAALAIMLCGDSGQVNLGDAEADLVSYHARQHQLSIAVPPLGMVVFKRAATR